MRRALSHAKFNTQDTCVCVCARLEIIYWQRLIIHVSGVFPCCWSRKWRSLHLEAVSQQLTQPSVSLETFIFQCRCQTVSLELFTPSWLDGYWPLVVLSWYDIGSIQVIFHGAQGRKCHFQFTELIILQESRSQAKQIFMRVQMTGIWIWHKLTEYWRSTSLKRCKHFLRYPGVIPSVCIVHFGKIETAVVQILNSSGLKGWTLNCPTLQKLSMLRSFFVHFWDFTGHKKPHKGGKKRKKRAKVICQTVNTSLLKHHVTRWPWTNKPRVARCRRV